MNKNYLCGASFLILASFIYAFSSTKGVNETKSLMAKDSLRNSTALIDGTKKKICMNISLEKTDFISTDSVMAKVRITNCSDVSLESSDFDGIIFSFSKRPLENRTRIVRGEMFQGGFDIEKFVPLSPTIEIPKELRSKDYFDFEVDISKAIWRDPMLSSVNLYQEEGLYSVPKGNYYLSAEIRLSGSGECNEGRAVFRSNEVEVNLQ
jgi:hypothetical protein